jgi:hypothetical protein
MAGAIEKQAERWTFRKHYKLDYFQHHEIIGDNLLMATPADLW